MAESVNGGSKTPAQPPKEMSMEVRLLIAFLLMGLVMFLTPYFFKSQLPPAGNKGVAGQTASQGTAGISTAPGAQPVAEATAPPASAKPRASRPVRRSSAQLSSRVRALRRPSWATSSGRPPPTRSSGS